MRVEQQQPEDVLPAICAPPAAVISSGQGLEKCKGTFSGMAGENASVAYPGGVTLRRAAGAPPGLLNRSLRFFNGILG